MINAGQSTLIGSVCSYCVFVPETGRSRITLVPFGFKGILPVASGRLELFGGFGGAYAWNSDYSQYRDALLTQSSVGARLALDHGCHFWLGTTLRAYFNYGATKQVWSPFALDLGIRLGH